IKRALEWKRLEKENILLKKDFESRYGFGNLIGASPRMLDIYAFIRSIASTKANVLISGESGTGKELAARAIHNESERKDKSFVAINCGAIPENLIESELFGHVKGAFTGAVVNKAGLVEMADGGTLFLDEVTELPRELQVKFLRFIQEKTIRRVGGIADTAVDIRIIAATNRVIEDEVKAGRFREDLFFRLNVIRIEMPPLRERKEDIPHIVRHFAAKYSAELRKNAVIKDVSEEALKCLLDYGYPGNVRELENAIERAVAIETKDHISKESLPDNIRNACRPVVPENISLPPCGGGAGWGSGVPDGGMDLEKTVSDFEKAMMLDALKKTGGVKKKAAELLGITFRSMRHKLSK
ncbi:MAG: sigma-54 dependent transcriptional regulator, partial [Deltaproteobacteria bacterium]